MEHLAKARYASDFRAMLPKVRGACSRSRIAALPKFCRETEDCTLILKRFQNLRSMNIQATVSAEAKLMPSPFYSRERVLFNFESVDFSQWDLKKSKEFLNFEVENWQIKLIKIQTDSVTKPFNKISHRLELSEFFYDSQREDYHIQFRDRVILDDTTAADPPFTRAADDYLRSFKAALIKQLKTLPKSKPALLDGEEAQKPNNSTSLSWPYYAALASTIAIPSALYLAHRKRGLLVEKDPQHRKKGLTVEKDPQHRRSRERP